MQKASEVEWKKTVEHERQIKAAREETRKWFRDYKFTRPERLNMVKLFIYNFYECFGSAMRLRSSVTRSFHHSSSQVWRRLRKKGFALFRERRWARNFNCT